MRKAYTFADLMLRCCTLATTAVRIPAIGWIAIVPVFIVPIVAASFTSHFAAAAHVHGVGGGNGKGDNERGVSTHAEHAQARHW